MGTLPALQQPYKNMYLVAILGLGTRQGWGSLRACVQAPTALYHVINKNKRT